MANRRVMRERACVQCGATPISGYKFCSDRCFQAALYARRAATPGFHEQNRFKVARSAQARRERDGKACRSCGSLHSFKRVQFCSDACRERWQADADVKRAEALKVVVADRPCSECGGTFTPRSDLGRFCSKKCARAQAWRASTVIRRARLNGLPRERFDPLEVLERDGWKCHLCGRATPKRLRGTTKANAPELDHIVPLSRGGPHTRQNTACACRRCNLKKSDQPLGQLRLIA